ncbi:histone-lysine N-methyltransferase MLL2-like, partial [Planoprotostelium fungivorum]
MERINSKSKVKQQSEIYRDSTLGQCLSTAAIELREENLLTEDQMEQIMRDFDVGELLSYNYSDSQWTMIAANSTFRVGLETIWVDCVKLLVQDGNSASPLFSSLSSPRGAASPAKHRRPKSSAATGTETEVSKVHKVDIKWKDIEIINDRNRSTFKGRWIHSETSHVVLIRKCTENPTDSSYVKEQLRLFRALPPHPHVGRVFGMIKRGPAGEKQSYTVEEVVEFQGDFVGNDLDSLIQKDIKWAALKEPQKILLLWEVAWALWQLHSAGLIHGNLNLHTVRGGSNGIKLTEYSFTSQNFVHTDGKEESRSAKLDVLQFGHFIINLFEKTAQASEEDPQPVVIPFPIQSIMDPCLAEVPMGLRKIAFECSQVNPDQRPSASRIFRTFEEEFLRGRIAMSKVEPTGLPFGLHLTVLTDENGNRVGSRDMTLPATLPAQAKELFKLRELVDRLNTQNMEKDRQTQHHLAQQLKNQRMMNELQGQLNTLKVQLEHKNVERNESKINVNSSVDQGMHEQLQREKIAGAETEGAIQLELMQLQMAQQARSEKLEQIQEARDKCNQEIEELKQQQIAGAETEGAIQLELMQLQMAQQARSEKLEQIQEARDKCNQEIEELKQQQEVKEREYEEQVKRKKEEHVRIDENHKQRLAQMDHDFAESHKNLVQAKPALSPNTSLYRKSLDPSAVALLQQQQQHQIAQLQGLNRSNSGGNAVQQVVTPVTLPMTTVQYPPATSQYPPATSQYPPGASPYPPTQVTPHYPPTTSATHPVQPPAQQTVHHDTL